MESALYIKSMMIFLLIIIGCFVLSKYVLPVSNVNALKNSDHYFRSCGSSLTNDKNARYHELNQTLSIRGIVNLSDYTIALNPSLILPSSILTTLPAYSHYVVELLDLKGRVLAHYPIDIIESTAKVEEWKNIAYISETIPYNPCTTKITLNKDDKELVSQVVSPNSPEIKSIKVSNSIGDPRIFPRTGNISIEWQAQDLDKDDNLTYFLLYSNNGGHTWPITIADNIKENSLTFNASSLPGNSANLSQFRVFATDGVNTDIRDSNPFSIPILDMGH
ncbi:MAG TPA: hypothetical protein VJR94_02990 [Candidatus Nitrosocosmicus sp.]|nr:hypothetical protein [Candidatus Nitrosocosmicus sp.]